MVQQRGNVPIHVNTGVMAVKAKLMVLLLYSGVQTPTVSPETDAEQVFILSRVSKQEAALRLVFQQIFCLVSIECWRLNVRKCASIDPTPPVHFPPIVTAVGDL